MRKIVIMLAWVSILVGCSKQGQILVQKSHLIKNMAADPDVREFLKASALQAKLIMSPFNQPLPSQEDIEANGLPEFKKPSQAEIEATVQKILADNLEQTRKVFTMGASIAQKYKLSNYSPDEKQDILRQVWIIIDPDSLKKLPK